MKEDTNVDNFIEHRGGWNCGHELIPASEVTVPKEIREKFKYPQKEGVVGKKEYKKKSAESLFSDPLQVNSFLKLYDFMKEKAIPKYRKIAFDNMLKNEKYQKEGDVFFMQGSEYSETEKQTADKLTKAGYYVVFPGKGQIKQIKELDDDKSSRKNDAYIYDKKSYRQQKVDLKTINGGSINSIQEHIISGSGQAPVVALDIQGNVNRWNVIKAIRNGWNDNTKRILLNYKGQWYDIDKNKAFGNKKQYKNWLEINIK
jgi:hypothetical protein